MAYIHTLADWPRFNWNVQWISDQLAAVRHKKGRLLGQMDRLGFTLRAEASLESLTEEVVKSSEIEGEILSREQVRSSIAQRLGLETAGLISHDRSVEGIVEIMLDATEKFTDPLTADRLFDWHAALFPTGRSGMLKIKVGGWRRSEVGPMQVVSGAAGREVVHFEAPSADRLKIEMQRFLIWFNGITDKTDPVLRAAIAHLWFVTIHPFEDGNGRIARAIADMALARSENSPQRFYSMSAQIRRERNEYYAVLERTQKGSLDITNWLEWFLDCLDSAFDGANHILSSVLRKADFWEKCADLALNERQRKVLNRLLDGLEGKLTSSKWAKIAKVSQATASRDIEELIDLQVLRKDSAGGRSTSYSLTDQQE